MRTLENTIVYLVHGFNVSDGGAATVGRLTPYLEREGATVHIVSEEDINGSLKGWRKWATHSYLRVFGSWRGLAGVMFLTPLIANHLAAKAREALVAGKRCILVGHSDGGRAVAMAPCSPTLCVLDHPALKVDWPAVCKKPIIVYYDERDSATMAARLWATVVRKLGAKEFEWGAAGTFGLNNFSRVHQYRTRDVLEAEPEDAHSGQYDTPYVGKFAWHLIHAINIALVAQER